MFKGQVSHGNENTLTVFLLGAILNVITSINVTTHLEYAIRAIIGGVIWLAFKILADVVSVRYFHNKDRRNDQ
jgi:hypothetical protein